jgi:hypothetical protein
MFQNVEPGRSGQRIIRFYELIFSHGSAAVGSVAGDHRRRRGWQSRNRAPIFGAPSVSARPPLAERQSCSRLHAREMTMSRIELIDTAAILLRSSPSNAPSADIADNGAKQQKALRARRI